MASLKASPRLGSTERGTGGGAEGAKTGAFGKGKEEKKRGCPLGSRRRGRCPPGVALRGGEWRSRAAEPGGSLRGRNVPQEALPPPEDEPGDSAGV